MKWIKRFFCWIGWHSFSHQYILTGFDGCNVRAKCPWCGFERFPNHAYSDIQWLISQLEMLQEENSHVAAWMDKCHMLEIKCRELENHND